MSEKIYAAVSYDFVRRMRNWARAVTGQIDALRSSWTLDPTIINHGLQDAPVPILQGEAADTDMALRTLPARFRWAVEEFWSREGRSLREHARGRRIDDHTMCAWVMCGHKLLETEFAKRTAVWREVSEARARVAAVGVC